jgi:hypothetical protein
MKPFVMAAAILIGISAMASSYSGGPATDSLTHLPLPDAASTLILAGDPMPLPNVPVCKSTATMNFYTARSGRVDAAIAWYTANLKGLKHAHGYGSGRSQDTFYSSDGTVIVSITGTPAAQGQNSDVYSIIYGAIKPGASEKAIIAMNMQKVDCT